MEFEINTEFAALSGTALSDYFNAGRAAYRAMVVEASADKPESIENLKTLKAHLDEVKVQIDAEAETAAAAAADLADLADAFADDDAEGGDDDADDDGDDSDDDENADDADEADDADAEEVVASGANKTGGVKNIAKKVKRPAPPAAAQHKPITITAAADVPEFSTGSTLGGMDEVGKALVNRMRGFSTPNGDGTVESLTKYGVASFKMDFPKELTIDRHSDDMEVLTFAASEKRLESEKGSKSLVAAGGWCAPSETLYDLCAGETTDGILSVPEVNVARGGIKYTSGPDFAAIYAAVGFLQTEAQAISGDTKTCYEVPCPSFTDVRLDAIGICLKAPILTNAAYPELVQRWLTGSMIAHQHKVNASVISRMVTASGAVKTLTGIGSVAQDTLGALESYADFRRQTYRLGLSSTMEVVLPFWAATLLRDDLQIRLGTTEPVTDAMLAAHFAARKLNVQWVYDWTAQTVAVTYPYTSNTTIPALIYPAGTFIKGTSDVISLSAVYDAASLAVNTYTALFFEQGLLVAKMCWGSDYLAIPVCAAGRTGAGNFTCA